MRHENFVVFHKDSDTSYMNSADNFRGAEIGAAQKIDIYFSPLTRYDRQKAQTAVGTDDALMVSTQLLCQIAQKEDGSKMFALADAIDLQRLLPEKVLNDIELFLFELKIDVETAKND